MRYSTYNAIPHNPKSKKHPYETLEKLRASGVLKDAGSTQAAPKDTRVQRLKIEAGSDQPLT
ncbi:hypothetical protein H6B51_14795 [Pseudoflavonifractor phocaeensis]|nr:hypothetical protein [Pseudoflavonifractor phocaeensis]